MRKTNLVFLAICVLFLLPGISKSQSRSALEDQAYDYLNNSEFVKAYEAFDQLHARYPKEIDYQFKLGICALGYPEKKERAIEIFQDMKNKNNTRESEYYLARAYHANYKFDEALAVLEPMVAALSESKKKEDKAMMDNAQIIINNCKSGKILIQNKLSSEVVNLGSPINTKELEGVPVITADESMMIFTYVGRKSMGGKVNAALEPDPNGIYTSDIYMSSRNPDQTWKMPVPVTALNTKANDAAIAISPDGLTLFTFLSTNENEGDILVSRLNGTEFSTPVPLNANINTPEYWEGSCSISADGKLLYFASERPGGIGGRDIWVSEWIDEDWGPAINLGPKINTEQDEDAPFIHPDGVTLFFSSKGHNSIGGYDIMFATKQGLEQKEWSEPKSMGIPLNTTEDDSYYVINSKGDKGYFSSDRATSEGRGSQDIYMVTPGALGEKLIVGLFKGIVYGDNNPIEARIDIVKNMNNENQGPYFTNKVTGKYLLTLKPGSTYKIKVFAEGFDPHEEMIDLEVLDSYMEKKKDFYLYTSAFVASNPAEIKKDTTSLSAKKTETIALVEGMKDEVTTPTLAVAAPEEPKTEIVEKKDPAIIKAEEKKAEIAAKAEEKKAALAAKAEEKKQKALAKAEARKKKETPKEEPEEESIAVTPCNGTLPDLSPVKGKSLNDAPTYKKLMEIAGNYCAAGLKFKVQVGAYKHPENFKYAKLESLGKVESEAFPDGITRFTQKEFDTLKEAERHRKKTISKGQKDSWIVAYLNDKRYTLEDFIMLDFLGKPIN
jgi:hypothetical protein